MTPFAPAVRPPLALALLGLVVAHILALHDVGSNNPDGIEIKAKKDANGIPLDGIPFHPYYTVHDILGVSVFLMLFSAVVFFAPELGGYFLEYNNFIPADPLTTPLHIAPVWYFTPFYSMLRAITAEMMYVLVACVVAGAVLGADGFGRDGRGRERQGVDAWCGGQLRALAPRHRRGDASPGGECHPDPRGTVDA